MSLSKEDFVYEILGKDLAREFKSGELASYEDDFNKLFKKFITYDEPLSTRLFNLNSDLSLRSYNKNLEYNYHGDTQINLAILGLTRGYFCIDVPGFFQALAYIFNIHHEQRHELRLLLLFFLFKNEEKYREKLDDRVVRLMEALMSDNVSSMTKEVLSAFSDMVGVSGDMIEIFDYELAKLFSFIALKPKANMKFTILCRSDTKTFYPVLCMPTSEILTRRAQDTVLIHSYVAKLDFSAVKPEDTGPSSTMRDSSPAIHGKEDAMTRLEDKDVQIMGEINHLIKNVKGQTSFVIQPHKSHFRFGEGSVKVVDLLRLQHQSFECRRVRVRAETKSFVLLDHMVLERHPINSPIERNAEAETLLSSTINFDEFADKVEHLILARRKSYETFQYVSNFNKIRLPAVGTQQMVERMTTKLDDILPGATLTKIYAGIEGSIFNFSFAALFGGHYLVNLGPAPLKIKTIPCFTAFTFVDRITRKINKEGYAEKFSACNIICKQGLYVPVEGFAEFDVVLEEHTVDANQIFFTRAGAAIQIISCGLSLFIHKPIAANDYSKLEHHTPLFEECVSRFFNPRLVDDLIAEMKKESSGGDISDSDYTGKTDIAGGPSGLNESIRKPSDDATTASLPRKTTARDGSDDGDTVTRPKKRGSSRRNIISSSSSDDDDDPFTAACSEIYPPVDDELSNASSGKRTNQNRSGTTSREYDNAPLADRLRSRTRSRKATDREVISSPERQRRHSARNESRESSEDRASRSPIKKPWAGRLRNRSGTQSRVDDCDNSDDSDFNSEHNSSEKSSELDSDELRKREARKIYICGVYPMPSLDNKCNCGKGLTSYKILHHHITRLDRVKKYKCNECTHACNNTDDLQRHYETKHWNVRYRCRFCEFMSAYSWITKNHQLNEHPHSDGSDSEY